MGDVLFPHCPLDATGIITPIRWTSEILRLMVYIVQLRLLLMLLGQRPVPDRNIGTVGSLVRRILAERILYF